MAFDFAALAARETETPYECLSDSATDYYGLGVRLGIYFAWLGSYIANTLLPAEFAGAADTSAVFLLALLVAMTNDSRTHALTQIDGLTLMHLCGGTVFGVLSIWGYRTRLYYDNGPRAVRNFGGFGTHLRLAISLGVSVYGLWFWLYGISDSLVVLSSENDTAEEPNDIQCATIYTFFFAKLQAVGGIRYYYTVVSAACALWFGVMFIVSSIAGVATFQKIRTLKDFFNWGTGNRAKYATGFTRQELKYMFMFLRVGNFLWLLWSAVTVEVTLNFNHVNGVLGGRHDGGQLQLPSQLLPFLIGLFSFLRTLYFLLKQAFESKEKRKAGKEKDEANEVLESQVIVSPMHFSPLPSKLEFGNNGFAPELPRADSYQIVARSLAIRLLVGWLPWLGLVVHPDTAVKSRLSALVERGTGLTAVSPRSTGLAPDTQYHQQFQQWAADTPGRSTPVLVPVQFVQMQPGQFTPPTASGTFAAPQGQPGQLPQGMPGHYPPSAPAQ
ncbi:hypothetical protein B0T16DRAFT_443848 [Cercophora newfieldiana]|uniref:Uncharacterized protein n=1 Tax=Cercophora newfieldiana TaxID=92897 RepID=A0AA39YHF6_9PEZI|nr:hypothetical protein B0T16DRAFT_443848 [Cercophora newfieldiana]